MGHNIHFSLPRKRHDPKELVLELVSIWYRYDTSQCNILNESDQLDLGFDCQLFLRMQLIVGQTVKATLTSAQSACTIIISWPTETSLKCTPSRSLLCFSAATSPLSTGIAANASHEDLALALGSHSCNNIYLCPSSGYVAYPVTPTSSRIQVDAPFLKGIVSP